MFESISGKAASACYSASQIEQYIGCPRKWAFQHLEGQRRDDTEATARGHAVHEAVEKYYKFGTPLDLGSEPGQLANELMPHLPPRADHLQVEAEFLLKSPKHRYYGLMDLRDPSAYKIYDHKTAGTFRFAKMPNMLAYDVQAMLYATTSFVEWPGIDFVHLQWTYTQTKGKRASLMVPFTVSREWAGTRFAEIESIADEMDSARGKRALELAPNPSECEKFGGCDFRHVCNLGPMERIRSIMSSGTDSLIASLRNKQSQAASGKSVEEIEAGQINPPESKLAGPGVKVEQEFQTVVSTETGEMKNSKIGKPKVTVVKAEVKTDKTKGIGTLYIDCSPTAPEGDGVLYDFAWLARDAAIMIQNTDFRDQNGGTYRVQDYRQVHFGQGPAAVVQAVNEYLDAHPIQELVVFSLMPEAQICLATLMSRAGRIVRGVR